VRISLQNASGQGSLTVDAGGTTDELTACVTEETASGYDATCDWDAQVADGPETLAVTVNVDASAEWPNQWNLQVVAFVPGMDSITLANVALGIQWPPGSMALSGSVVTVGGVPVAGACIFLLAAEVVVPAIADGQGNWAVTGLPDDIPFAVGIVPPFTGEGGPCVSNGPPQPPAAGELEPEFLDNIWINLADPELVAGDPYAYAVARGARSFSAPASGLVACLTTDPGDVVPRPACLVQQPSTTTTTQATTTTSLPGATTTTRPPGSAIASTGGSGPLGAVGASLLVVGLLLLGLARRSGRVTHR
jgi:hypothetical protein